MRRRDETYFLPYQARWIKDEARLKIVEKGRQIGMSYADSYDSVVKAALDSSAGGRDVWVMSRDEVQAKQYIRYCKHWANVLKYAAEAMFDQPLMTDSGKALQVQVISFASGFSIYALSSNPDAIVGKTGHVKLDEFALHKSQREVYAVAKPVTQWGGTLTIISTHRGVNTVFNEIIRDVRERGNKMGWSLHSIPIQRAVEDGIVEKINAATGANESREAFLARLERECIDQEQWLQEYCCVPADESAAWINYEMIRACEDDSAPKGFAYLEKCINPIYVGVDLARTTHLTVIDCEEKIGDVLWERMRIELQNKTFSEQKFELQRILRLPAVKRMDIDSTGIGRQMAEELKFEFGWKVEPVNFTMQSKADMAVALRKFHEDRLLRYAHDEKLINDIRGIKKEVTTGGNERFVGESADSHCDRFWAKALAVTAAASKQEVWAMVG